MTDPIISLENYSFQYALTETPALNDISVQISKYVLLAILVGLCLNARF